MTKDREIGIMLLIYGIANIVMGFYFSGTQLADMAVGMGIGVSWTSLLLIFNPKDPPKEKQQHQQPESKQ